MDLDQQHQLIEMWHAYLGDPSYVDFARNADMVAFYLDIVRESPLYEYGMSSEVFDVLTNGPFDMAQVSLEHYAEHIVMDRSAA